MIRLFGNVPDNPARITGCEDPIGDVSRDHAPGPDDRLRPDANAGTDDGSPAYPHVGANCDRLGELLLPPQLGIHRVRGGVDLDGRAKQGVVADADLADVEHDAVEVEEDP